MPPLRLSRVALAGILLTLCHSAIAARGEVSHRVSGCDYFVVETSKGYAVLEWYGGNDPDKGDTITGSFTSYGFKDVLNESSGEAIHVWVEDYGLSKSSALEKLVEHCE
jgi:hypothetical protein